MEKNHILIVDDNLANIHIIETILRKENYQVTTTTNGIDALELAQQVQPDLILLDVVMSGIDGFETCKRLKAIDSIKEIPIIFLTAEKDSKSMVKGLNLGAVDYLTKPFISIEFRTRLKAHLELKKSKALIIQKNSEQKALLKKLQSTINTVGNSTLELVREIDETGDAMSKELLLQKMKLNILKMLIAAGQEHLQEEYDRLKAGAVSGNVKAQDQKSVDDLLSQFGM